jgi:arabinofuranan 3-O-arabinosyltransferase
LDAVPSQRPLRVRRGALPRFLTQRPPVGVLMLAVVSYVPLLLTHRGKLGADTKAYLYLDPAKLMGKAAYLWDPSVGLGTVTHQNIGYLFPTGPYYWLLSELHVPDWIAQRLWFGSIIFLAGLGVRYLLHTLRWEGPGVTVASFA